MSVPYIMKLDDLYRNDIGLTKPENRKGKRTSHAYVRKDEQHKAILVQLPYATLTSIERDDNSNLLSVDVKLSEQESNSIVAFKDWLAMYLFDRSEKFFDGRSFSLDRFKEAVCHIAIDDILHVTVDSNVPYLRIKDQYDGDRSLEDLSEGQSIRSLVTLRYVTFEGRKIVPHWQLCQAKIYIEETLDDWCIQDREEDQGPPESSHIKQEQSVELSSSTALQTPESIPLPDDTDVLDTPATLTEQVQELQPQVEPLNDDDKNFF